MQTYKIKGKTMLQTLKSKRFLIGLTVGLAIGSSIMGFTAINNAKSKVGLA